MRKDPHPSHISPERELDDEARRITALRSTGLLDTEPHADFDEIVQLAAAICETPICLISLVDERRQWFLSRVGLEAKETSRDVSFCAHVIKQDEMMEIPNALEDERFSENPLVTGDMQIRFYAGCIITAGSGEKLGTLCVIDRQPRQLTQVQRTALEVLSRQVMAQIELKARLRATESSLTRSEDRYRALMEAASDPIVVVNEAEEIVLVNAQAEKHFGYRRDELLGHKVSNIIPKGFAERLIADDTWTTEALSQQLTSGIELSARHKSGAEFPVEVILSPLATEHGILMTAAIRNVTERKRAEEHTRQNEQELRRQAVEIRKLNEDLEEKIAKRTAQLEAANRELEAFSYSVSHDLRAPLRHIAGFSSILQKDFGAGMPVEAREHLQHIEQAVRRMGQLVDALLSLAKLGQQSLRLHNTQLNSIVVEVIALLQQECEGRAVEWRIGELPTIDCDPILMGQVFQNLLGNALKYSRGRTPGIIEVDSIQQPGKPAVIFVRDNGAGFNMKYAQKLFGVFQRMHTESEFEGTGVGLATVDRIIRKHGGNLWAEAEIDQGATFYFTMAPHSTGVPSASVPPTLSAPHRHAW